MEISSQAVLVAQEKIKTLQALARSVSLNDRDPLTLSFIEGQVDLAEEMIHEMFGSNSVGTTSDSEGITLVRGDSGDNND